MEQLTSFLDTVTATSLNSIINVKSWFKDASQYYNTLGFGQIRAMLTSSAATCGLIIAAEIGDKSQLVCMALAAKHRPVPILLGAVTAFALLNSLAVGFGAVVAKWFPDHVIALAVALLFIIFGIQALRTEADESEESLKEKSGHGIFVTTFLLITIAEFGDKTQLAVVALSSTYNPVGVWLGATIALGVTSSMGIVAGRKLVQKFPLEFLHKISGVLFLILAGFALVKTYTSYSAY